MFSSSSTHQTYRKRPIAIHKNPLPPTVSFVIAAPQQTRSLASAADNLPNILRRAMPHDPPQSNTTPMTNDGPPQSSPLNAVHESDQLVSAYESVSPTTSPVLTPDQPHVNAPLHPVELANASEVTSHGPAPVSSLSNKRSWFSLFSWSRDKEISVAEVKVETDPAQEASELAVVHICADSLANRAELNPLETVKPTNSTTPAGDSVHRVDVSRDTPSQLPHSSSVSPSRPDGPSIREELPASHTQSVPVAHHSSIPQTLENVPSPTASNSTPGIFSFNFPILTKFKPPLETAVITISQDPSAPPSGKSLAGTPGIAIDAVSVNMTEPTSATSASTAHVSESGDQSLTHTIAAKEVRTNTWWAYLGWNETSPVQAGAGGSSLAESPSVGDHAASAIPSQPPASDPAASSQPEGKNRDQMDNSSDVGSTECLPPTAKHLSSAANANTAKAPPGYAWYAPWSWYPSSPPATAATNPIVNSNPQQSLPEHTQTNSDAEERQHDEGALPDAVLDQASPASQGPTSTASVDFGNPIQSAISANPTGWMSFFTARAIAMKSITYEKEGENMEVMEIDDEMAPEPNSGPVPPPTATHPSPIQLAKPPTRTSPITSDTIPLSSPSPQKSDDKRMPTPHAATYSETAVNDSLKRQPSPSPSKKSSAKAPASPPPPNLVLPTWKDTFHTLPRSEVPHGPPSALSKTLQYVSGVLFSRNEGSSDKGKGKAKESIFSPYDRALPRTWDVLGGGETTDMLRGCKRVVIIGVHGWFPGTVIRTLTGEPTGTSSRFVNGLVEALDVFQREHKVEFDKVTKIPLEGEGTINRRVERLYQILTGNNEWMDDLHDADAILFATHSQGSVVSTHILDRLIADRHVRTTLNADPSVPASGVASGSVSSVKPPQRICCLALCGIHLGPLRYLSTSSLVQPYIQYFESTAARELFEFQNTESPISRNYLRALRNVLNNGIKMVYIASLNDQVVGLYSGLFASVSHPLILRALYIDGDAYHSSDFLANLLVLLLRIRNAGLSDGGLLTHLSEATAGSLNGIGHSTPYEERATYSLAVNYLFLTDCGPGAPAEFVEEPFNALAERNDYEIPWALRDLIADERVARLFSDDIVALRDAFRDWHPKTAILRDVKRKLQPIQRLSSTLIASRVSRL